MPKEKNYNPVQEAKKADKAKQIRKQKANLQAQRNEKLARRNPHRIQRDIDSLKELVESGVIRPHEKQRLQELERDLAAVNKARAALGDKAPVFKPERRHDERERNDREGGGRGGRGGGVLGKRGRDGHRKEDDSSDTDADVQHIPMPRDTPPPIPRRYQNRDAQAEDARQEPKKATIVYEAAPQVRDLRKEATKFMPTSVAQKIKLAKGEGRLLDEDEFDKLRDEGYMKEKKSEGGAEGGPAASVGQDEEVEAFLRLQDMPANEMADQAAEAAVQEAEYAMMAAEEKGQMAGISSEAKVAESKLKHVQMEEVEDEDL